MTRGKQMPYTDGDLGSVLSAPPTTSNVRRFAHQLGRCEDAIKIIYDIATTRWSHLSVRMRAGKFYKQVRRVAADLGWTTVRKIEGTKASRCPKCGSRKALPIIYGMVSDEMMLREKLGEVVLGGCLIEDHLPSYRCGDCKHEWGSRKTAVAAKSRGRGR